MSKKYAQDTIELYLKKQLKGAELEAFEAEMAASQAFKKEVQTQQLLYRAANKAGEDEMRLKLQKIRAEVLENTAEDTAARVVPLGEKKRTNALFRWSIAAAVVIALGAALYWLVPGSSSAEELFANYYEPYTGEITTRGGDTETLLDQANQWYQNGDFGSALPLFQQALSAGKENAELLLVIGICQLELNRYDQAVEIFKSIENPLYLDQARWYLAMAYLKSGDLANAKNTLSEIPPGAFNYSRAQEILNKE